MKNIFIGISFNDLELLRETLTSVMKVSDYDIFIVDNYSASTDREIRPFLENAVKSGDISGAFFFDSNITANALSQALEVLASRLSEYKYVTLSDMDLCPEEGWYNEIENVLSTREEVFSVSIKLSLDNAPLSILKKYPDATLVDDMYEIFRPGMHFTTTRSMDFAAFYKWLIACKLPLLDRTLEDFGTYVIEKRTCQTTRKKAIHLSWNKINDAKYLKSKSAGVNLWWHNNFSNFTLLDKSGVVRYVNKDFWSRSFQNRQAIQWSNFEIKNDLDFPVFLNIFRVWPHGGIKGTKAVELNSGQIVNCKHYLKGYFEFVVTASGFDSIRYKVLTDDVPDCIVLSALI